MEAQDIPASEMEVFRGLQDLMASEDFINAQLDFIKHNMDKFDEEEENKIEYTGIYETYVGIME